MPAPPKYMNRLIEMYINSTASMELRSTSGPDGVLKTIRPVGQRELVAAVRIHVPHQVTINRVVRSGAFSHGRVAVVSGSASLAEAVVDQLLRATFLGTLGSEIKVKSVVSLPSFDEKLHHGYPPSRRGATTGYGDSCLLKL